MEKDQPKTFVIPQVPFKALINIEVSGGFLRRCQDLLVGVAEDMGQEGIQLALKKFKETADPPADKDEAILYILLALVGEIEQKALDQKKTEDITVTDEQLKEMFGPKTS